MKNYLDNKMSYTLGRIVICSSWHKLLRTYMRVCMCMWLKEEKVGGRNEGLGSLKQGHILSSIAGIETLRRR